MDSKSLSPRRLPIQSIASLIRRTRQRQHLHGAELTALCLQRLRYLIWIAVPVSALHLLFFAGFQGTSQAELNWHRGIMFAHTLMLSGFLLLAAVIPRVANNPAGLGARLTTILSLLGVLGTGICIAVVDQWITAAITPFLVACTVAGVLFINSPFVSVVVYPAALAVFWFALSLTQTDATLLLTARVNGITATGLALGLSIMLWHQLMIRKEQELMIADQQRELQHLASRDALTGLANRRLFDLLLTQEVSAIARSNGTATLMMLDLDHFKRINDVYGHLQGDKVLIRMSELLTSALRASDLIGRWGGEEFVILLRNTPLDEAMEVAESLRTRIAAEPVQLSEDTVSITVSIGAAEILASSPNAIERAYQQADKALYQAKAGGRNRVIAHPA